MWVNVSDNSHPISTACTVQISGKYNNLKISGIGNDNSVREHDARAFPLAPIRQHLTNDEVRHILPRHSVAIIELPISLRTIRGLPILRPLVPATLPVRKQRRSDDHQVLELARAGDHWGGLPAVRQNLRARLVLGRPGQPSAVRKQALRTKFVGVWGNEPQVVKWFQGERNGGVRLGCDAVGCDNHEARLGLDGAQ